MRTKEYKAHRSGHSALCENRTKRRARKNELKLRKEGEKREKRRKYNHIDYGRTTPADTDGEKK